MKIALIGLTFPYRGGISHFTTTLFRYLQKKHSVRLISFSRLYPDLLFPGKTQFDFSGSAFKVSDAATAAAIDTVNPFTWIKTFLFIKRFRPRKVVFMWWSPVLAPCYFAIATLLKWFGASQSIFYCHNVFPHENNFLARRLTRLALGAADGFLTHADSDAATLRRVFPGVPAKKTFHPLYDIFPKKGISQKDARKALAMDERSNVILFFGHIRKYKGLDILIKALSKVAKELDCALVIAGEFYEPKEKYLRIISEEGLEKNIVVHDRYIANDAMETYFAAADILALPYRSGSQSGVVQIAYHFGKPVVSTQVGGLPEVVEPGRTGYLVPPENPHALAEAILRFYQERGAIDFAANIQTYKTKFSWDSAVEAIEGLPRGGNGG
ncbi:MAG: glycosyltransferase [Nitrospinales bacterium]